MKDIKSINKYVLLHRASKMPVYLYHAYHKRNFLSRTFSRLCEILAEFQKQQANYSGNLDYQII